MTGIPFVGSAGQLLDKMLAAVNLSLEDVYVANIVKCRPPGNRDPHDDEKEACLNYLRYQLAMIHPKIIVCLGRIAATTIISPDFKITKMCIRDRPAAVNFPATARCCPDKKSIETHSRKEFGFCQRTSL